MTNQTNKPEPAPPERGGGKFARSRRISRRWAAFLAAVLGMAAAAAGAAEILEDFSTNPFAPDSGWQASGQTNLFAWDESRLALAVTWDSSQPNSFFHHPLGATLSKRDDFAFAFSLVLEEITIGTNPERPFTFQVAAGLINQRALADTNLFRGTGRDSPNLAEFTYFPDSGFGATVSPVIVSSNNQFIPTFAFPLELIPGAVYEVEMVFTAANRTLATTLKENGEPAGPIRAIVMPPNFSDFELDAFSISSYSDAGADGSLLARGWVDNIRVRMPAPLVINGQSTAEGWNASIPSRAGWTHVLERSGDLKEWVPASEPLPGSGSELQFLDTNRFERAFYRVKSEPPQ